MFTILPGETFFMYTWKTTSMFCGSILFSHLTKMGSLFATYCVCEKSHRELRDPWFKVKHPYEVAGNIKMLL